MSRHGPPLQCQSGSYKCCAPWNTASCWLYPVVKPGLSSARSVSKAQCCLSTVMTTEGTGAGVQVLSCCQDFERFLSLLLAAEEAFFSHQWVLSSYKYIRFQTSLLGVGTRGMFGRSPLIVTSYVSICSFASYKFRARQAFSLSLFWYRCRYSCTHSLELEQYLLFFSASSSLLELKIFLIFFLNGEFWTM